MGLKSVETPDDHTIVFNLASANSDFKYLLAMPSSSPVPAGKDEGASYTNKPVATGPYKVESFASGKGATFVRNENWDQATDTIRKGLPDKVTFTVTTNPDDMDQRLLSGDIDLAVDGTGVQQAAKNKILKDANLKKNADNPYTGYIRYFAFPQTVAPFDNIECRKAVIYAADPKSLQNARGGPTSGDLGANMLPPGIPGSDKKYDPFNLTSGKPQLDKAKAALKACGKPDGFETTIAVRNNRAPEVKSAESLQAALAKIGVKATIDQYDGKLSSSTIGSPENVKKKNYGIIVMGWGATTTPARASCSRWSTARSSCRTATTTTPRSTTRRSTACSRPPLPPPPLSRRPVLRPDQPEGHGEGALPADQLRQGADLPQPASDQRLLQRLDGPHRPRGPGRRQVVGRAVPAREGP